MMLSARTQRRQIFRASFSVTVPRSISACCRIFRFRAQAVERALAQELEMALAPGREPELASEPARERALALALELETAPALAPGRALAVRATRPSAPPLESSSRTS